MYIYTLDKMTCFLVLRSASGCFCFVLLFLTLCRQSSQVFGFHFRLYTQSHLITGNYQTAPAPHPSQCIKGS